MPTTRSKSNATKTQPQKKKSLAHAPASKEPWGIRVITDQAESKLELRRKLSMTRELFSRLVNTSVRTIATIESMKNVKSAAKFGRNYAEVNRLCQTLSEVVEPAFLGDWLSNPNNAFDGLKPLEVIERGEIDRLWDMVYRLRSGMSG